MLIVYVWWVLLLPVWTNSCRTRLFAVCDKLLVEGNEVHLYTH